MNKILERGQIYLRSNCIITGGHFRIFFEDKNFTINLNDGTLKSFLLSVKLYKIAITKNLKPDLGILINDMNSSCDEEGCILPGSKFSRDGFILPVQYLKILKEEAIPVDLVIIYWEKHMRNRGKKELLKKIKKKTDNILNKPKGLFLKDSGGYEKILLTRPRANDKYGAPACPLIIAGLNIDQDKKYNSSVNFYYIGEDNHTNIPNYFVIEKGKRVSEFLGSKIIVNNIFFD